MLYVGTAGWSIPKAYADEFPEDGSHLERYSRRLNCVEINSSFYRPHKPSTYARWAAAVPPEFRFAVKMPREITHNRKLIGVADVLERFLGEIAELGDKLGPVLIQLPPRLAYDTRIAATFFKALRARFKGDVVCEPRHATWFTADVNKVLKQFHVARVAADPVLAPGADTPAGWEKITYRRLHGSPKIYYSTYSKRYVKSLALAIGAEGARQSWCIFDNTALGAATGNALELQVDKSG